MFGISDLIMGGISGIASLFNTDSNNKAALQRQQEANQFNAGQAQITRDWTAGQAGIARDFNAQEAVKARDFSDAQAEQQMQFQDRMSSSAYSRAAADMQKAGLNRILALGGQSSSPGGAMGSSSAASIGTPSGSTASGGPAQTTGSGVGEAFQKGLSTAQQARALAAQNDLIKEDLNKREKDTTNVVADTKVKIANANLINQQERNAAVENKIKQELVHVAIGDAAKSKNEKSYRESAAGKALQILGMGGQDFSRIVAPIGALTSSAKSASSIIKDRYDW